MKNTIDLSRFEKLKMVGEGSFGQVYCVKEKDTGQIYAAKISINTYKEKSRDERLNLKREVNTLSQLNHPSVLKFIGYSQTNFDGESKPVIITEYLPHGALDKLILASRDPKSKVKLNITNKLIIIYGIASAMSYLHSNGFIHRDLKPANILIDDSLYPIIADFGLAKIIHKDSEKVDQTQSVNIPKGTPAYIAPEIIQMENDEEEIVYTNAVDVYAFSIIVYELFSKQPPFTNITIFKLYQKVAKGERPTITDDIPKNFADLIKKCWSQDPSDRPSFDEIVNELKSDKFLSDEKINRDEFNKYVDYIQNYSIIYPAKKFNLLSSSCQKIVKQAESNPELQFQVGRNLIEGINGFPKDITVGTAYLSHSADKKCLNAIKYYSNMLIEGDVIDRDIKLVKKYLKPLKNTVDDKEKPFIYLLYAKAMINKPNYGVAQRVLKLLFDLDSPKLNKEQNQALGEGYFEYGRMYYEGKGKEQNLKKANEYFEKARMKGYKKVDSYLSKMENEEENENEKNQIDIVFLVDGTFSMSHFIESIKNSFVEISKNWKKKYPDYDFMYGSVVYRDTAVTRLFKAVKGKHRIIDHVDCYDLTDDADEIVNFFSHIRCVGGGGDGPEDWGSGFSYLLNRITWREEAIKIVIHVADAPGHGKHFTSKKGFYGKTMKVPFIDKKKTRDENLETYNREIQNKPDKWIFSLICQLAQKNIMFYCMNGSDKAMQCFQATQAVYYKRNGPKYLIMNQFNCSVFKSHDGTANDNVNVENLTKNMKELALNAVDISIDISTNEENEPSEFELECNEQFEENLAEYEKSVVGSRSAMQSDDSVASFSSVNSNISRNSTREIFDFDSDFDDSDDDEDDNKNERVRLRINLKVDKDDDEDDDDDKEEENVTNVNYTSRNTNNKNRTNNTTTRRPFNRSRGQRRGRRFYRRRGGRYNNRSNRTNADQEENSDDDDTTNSSNNRTNYNNKNRGNYNRRGRGGYRNNEEHSDDDDEGENQNKNRNNQRNYNRGRNNYNRGSNNQRGRGGYRNNGDHPEDDDDGGRSSNYHRNYNQNRGGQKRGGYQNRGGQRRDSHRNNGSDDDSI